MKKTLSDWAEEILKKASQPLTSQEIWKEIEKSSYSPNSKTPKDSLSATLYVDVKKNPDSSKFLKIETKPVRFFLKSRESEIKSIADIEKAAERQAVEQSASKSSYQEKDLHPLLTYFAFAHGKLGQVKGIVTKTIRHEKSKKKGFSEWVYPDMVGAYIPTEDWENETVDFAQNINNTVIKLYSFELKIAINKGNYREAFFQAVSNSSWAHEGYLVAAEIAQDEDLASELRRLSSSLGIGIIDGIKNPDSWSILYPATSKSNLDWETINKLCRENKDFEGFLKHVKDGLHTKDINLSKFNPIFDNDDDLDKYIKDKKIR